MKLAFKCLMFPWAVVIWLIIPLVMLMVETTIELTEDFDDWYE